MDAPDPKNRIVVGPYAKIIWKSPDLNTGDLDHARAQPNEWERESGAKIPQGFIVTLLGDIEMDTEATWGNTWLKIKAEAVIELSAEDQRERSIQLRHWVDINNLSTDPAVWLLYSGQPKLQRVRWYKSLLESPDVDPSILRGWTDALFSTVATKDTLTCNIPITW